MTAGDEFFHAVFFFAFQYAPANNNEFGGGSDNETNERVAEITMTDDVGPCHVATVKCTSHRCMHTNSLNSKSFIRWSTKM